MTKITEENLTIERDTFALKREYKYALENLTTVKKDTQDAIDLKEKVSSDVASKQAELTKILNQISEEKTAWAQHRHQELMDIENKQTEVEAVLKRKSELDTQEEKIEKTKQKNSEILQEKRQLEFKMGQDKTALEVREYEIEQQKKDIKNREEKLLKNTQDFKQKVIGVLQQIENL